MEKIDFEELSLERKQTAEILEEIRNKRFDKTISPNEMSIIVSSAVRHWKYMILVYGVLSIGRRELDEDAKREEIEKLKEKVRVFGESLEGLTLNALQDAINLQNKYIQSFHERKMDIFDPKNNYQCYYFAVLNTDYNPQGILRKAAKAAQFDTFELCSYFPCKYSFLLYPDGTVYEHNSTGYKKIDFLSEEAIKKFEEATDFENIVGSGKTK